MIQIFLGKCTEQMSSCKLFYAAHQKNTKSSSRGAPALVKSFVPYLNYNESSFSHSWTILKSPPDLCDHANQYFLTYFK